MKQLITTSLFLLYCFVSYAQYIPDFETKLYFEDAMGNRDTITIGHDSTSTDELNAHLGEFELTTPFDSVFEVRADDYMGFHRGKLSKKIITWSERIFNTPIRCWGGTDIHMYIVAKYNPVTVTWDKSTFEEQPCRGSSLITNQFQDVLALPFDWDNDDPNTEYSCMGLTNTFTFYTDLKIDQQPLAPIMIEKEVEGKGMQTIYGIRYHNRAFANYPCAYRVVSTEDHQTGDSKVYTLYPNPVNDILYFEGQPGSEVIAECSIYDLQGKLVHRTNTAFAGIEVGSLSAGVYVLKIQTDQGKGYSRKFLKL